MKRPFDDERLEIAVQALEELRKWNELPSQHILDVQEFAYRAGQALREIERLSYVAPPIAMKDGHA